MTFLGEKGEKLLVKVTVGCGAGKVPVGNAVKDGEVAGCILLCRSFSGWGVSKCCVYMRTNEVTYKSSVRYGGEGKAAIIPTSIEGAAAVNEGCRATAANRAAASPRGSCWRPIMVVVCFGSPNSSGVSRRLRS